MLTVRYISPHAQAPEDFEMYTHSNESLATLRRHINQRYIHTYIRSYRYWWWRPLTQTKCSSGMYVGVIGVYDFAMSPHGFCTLTST